MVNYSKYSQSLIDKFQNTSILKRHTKAFKEDEKINRECKLTDRNITKILKKKK